MKTIKPTIIWTITIFIATTLLTAKQEAAFDRIDAYGFPFIFYDNFGGKCDNCYDNFGFKPVFLFVDLLIIMSIVCMLIIVRNKYIKAKSN